MSLGEGVGLGTRGVDVGVGIGAGVDTDGQVLVMQDMLGITQEFKPRFLRRYADLNAVVTESVRHYIQDVKAKDFPGKDEMY